jgi:inosine triphosphate pyrophosphatase
LSNGDVTSDGKESREKLEKKTRATPLTILSNIAPPLFPPRPSSSAPQLLPLPLASSSSSPRSVVGRGRYRAAAAAKKKKKNIVVVVGMSAKTTAVGEQKAVTFVTGNKKKLEEVKSILALGDDSGGGGGGGAINLISRSVDLPELQGDPLDIAREKCLLASKEINGPTLVEDTSLCFNALKGLPGPYVKWFLEKTGLDGLNNMLCAYEDKTAYAQCIFAYCDGAESAEDVEVFVGRTNGRIVKARGKTEFGWDAVFEPDEQRDANNKKTYGEMEKEEKNAISHRFRALEKLREAKFR